MSDEKSHNLPSITGVLSVLTVLISDQATKWGISDWLKLSEKDSVSVLPFLNLTMVRNRGITFGLFTQDSLWGQWLLVCIALSIIVVLCFWLHRAENTTTGIAIGTIIGGALGNITDRIRFNAVTDFIHLHAFGKSWYIFNVADAAIVCGVAVLMLNGIVTNRKVMPL